MRWTGILVLVPLLLCSCYLESCPVYRSQGLTAGASAAGFRQRGVASYYGEGFDGNLTASGEVFHMNELTCAHPSLPFGTVLRVTNLDNGKETTVRVNDRGPYYGGRIVDLSYGAAQELGMLEAGTARVLLEVSQ